MIHLLKLLTVAIIAATGLCFQPQEVLQHTSGDPYAPSLENARGNANLIFNAIHSSMRQWGSSLQHNGLSFFPAYIPEGTILYRGGDTPHIPSTREWLAFEIEHAMMFAKQSPGAPGNWSEASKFDRLMTRLKSDTQPTGLKDNAMPEPGYLQIYRATRPLERVLYFDGSSAGNSPFGMLDTQDLVFLNKSRPPLQDMKRADDLCTLGAKWNIEAFIRMEAGFELIKCNFSDGLELLSARRTPRNQEPAAYDDRFLFEYMRSVSMRHQDIGAHRVTLDYSSMVSSYFYGTNLSNPDTTKSDASLPRIAHTEPEQLYRIRSDLKKTLSRKRSFQSTVDWQGVVDMVVSRYADRLQLMAGGLLPKQLLAEINTLLNMFVDYEDAELPEEDPVKECTLHYLSPLTVEVFTEQDHMISAAIEQVTNKICKTLFKVREILLDQAKFDLMDTRSSVALILELNKWLNWTVWKYCGHCKPDQVCFIAAWPYGLEEDHYNPGCLSHQDMESRRTVQSYWFPDGITEGVSEWI